MRRHKKSKKQNQSKTPHAGRHKSFERKETVQDQAPLNPEEETTNENEQEISVRNLLNPYWSLKFAH